MSPQTPAAQERLSVGPTQLETPRGPGRASSPTENSSTLLLCAQHMELTTSGLERSLRENCLRDIRSVQCLVAGARAPSGSCWFVLVATPLTTAISPFYPAPYKDFGAEMWNRALVAFDFTHDTGSTGTVHVVTLVSPTPCSQQDSPTQERRTHLLAQLAENRANAQTGTDTARQGRRVWSAHIRAPGLTPNNS